MFAISERVSPWRARCWARSVGRVTRISPFSCLTSISRETRSSRSPRGPATRTTVGSIVTVTPVGPGMVFWPMRDMELPDLGDDLAADALLAGVVAGHHAVRRGQDRGPHAPEDLRDVLGVDVRALAGPRDAPQARDHRRAVARVLQADDDLLAGVPGDAGLRVVALDIPLLGEDARHLGLEPRRGDLDLLVGGHDAVADAGQEVGDGIGHGHRSTTYQELLVMPGM